MSSRKQGRASNPPETEQTPDAVNGQRVSKYQRFNVQRIPRSMLKEAPYNPR